jgi:bacillithiol system protein YtxJ
VINWKNLDSLSSLDDAMKMSDTRDVLFFKHSTTCSISHMAKLRLEDNWDFDENELLPYYLDLKNFKSVSAEIANRLSVVHESPQVLLIRKGECIYDASHFDISVDELKETLNWHG